VLEGLAACFLRVGNYSEAVEWQQERILLNPPKVEAFARLGMYQLAAGDREGAKNSLARSVEMDPLHDSVFALQLQFAIGKGRVVETELLFDEWDRAGDGRSLLNWYLRSQYAMDLGDLDKALDTSTSCVQMNFQYSPIRVLRSELFRRLGRLDQARTALDTIASKSLVVVGIEAIQIRIDADLGLHAQAHRRLRALQEIDPIRPDVLASAWYLAQAEGDDVSANLYRNRYEKMQSNPYRILESLIPVTPSRGTP
jgi:tetratricopeptide (TPR) repeat protein